MDYVKPVAVKLLLQVATSSVVGCAGWAIQCCGDCERTATLSKRKFERRDRGAGGSGMRPRCSLRKRAERGGASTGVSHPIAHRGGAGRHRRLARHMREDNWHYQFFDTVKGSDWLGDQDAIEFMCREAPKVVYRPT